MTATSRTVDSHGVALSTRDFGGDGAPLVLMHGAGMRQASLDLLIAELGPAYRVVTFDFRGHGGSTAGPWTFATAVQDLEAVIAAYGLDNPAVGGHSLGGMIAAQYAAAHPTCPGAINLDGQGTGRVDQYVGLDEADVRAWWATHQRLAARVSGGPIGLLLKAIAVVTRQQPPTSPETTRQVMAAVDSTDLFTLYRSVRCPLLVFNATADEDRRLMLLLMGNGLPFLRAYRQGLRRDFAALAQEQGTFQVAEMDATHMLIRTHPGRVARVIDAFLQQ